MSDVFPITSFLRFPQKDAMGITVSAALLNCSQGMRESEMGLSASPQVRGRMPVWRGRRGHGEKKRGVVALYFVNLREKLEHTRLKTLHLIGRV